MAGAPRHRWFHWTAGIQLSVSRTFHDDVNAGFSIGEPERFSLTGRSGYGRRDRGAADDPGCVKTQLEEAA
jgi:hypothetical protein